MKRKIIIRGLLGFPVGVTICLVITIIESLIAGDGRFYACVPEFVEITGSEVVAVIIQTVLSGLDGSALGAGSIIWDMENWSIAKQSGAFFAVAAIAMLPAGYFLNWIEHSLSGVIRFFLIFTVIFVIVWVVMYLAWRRKIWYLNESVQKRRIIHNRPGQ